MKCSECEKQELKSNVYVGVSMSTCMGYEPYYDENGNWHDHDPNTIETDYFCNNGHKWTERAKRTCLVCGWSNK